MTPEFALAVDPIFLHVLELLERIERNETPSAKDERSRVRSQIDRAEAMLGRKPDWELAKYALVSWIDDLLIEAPWDGRQWWEENALEVELFNSRDAFSKFYVQAEEAQKLTKKDALEVYYVCVVLGFRGLYRDSNAEAELLGLPASLEEWARKTAMAINLGLGRPPITVNSRPGEGAPPLEGRFNLVGMSIVAVILTAVTLMFAEFMFDVTPF
jgi:type VI secretion system protein ImpK